MCPPHAAIAPLAAPPSLSVRRPCSALRANMMCCPAQQCPFPSASARLAPALRTGFCVQVGVALLHVISRDVKLLNFFFFFLAFFRRPFLSTNMLCHVINSVTKNVGRFSFGGELVSKKRRTNFVIQLPVYFRYRDRHLDILTFTSVRSGDSPLTRQAVGSSSLVWWVHDGAMQGKSTSIIFFIEFHGLMSVGVY